MSKPASALQYQTKLELENLSGPRASYVTKSFPTCFLEHLAKDNIFSSFDSHEIEDKNNNEIIKVMDFIFN